MQGLCKEAYIEGWPSSQTIFDMTATHKLMCERMCLVMVCISHLKGALKGTAALNVLFTCKAQRNGHKKNYLTKISGSQEKKKY